MKVGIDVSQSVYGTGVADYTIELVRHLSRLTTVIPVGFTLRRRRELKELFPQVSVYPIPPSALNLLWNRLHVINFENFAPGNIDVYHSSDWTQAPDSSPKVTTIHDLTPFLFPGETDPQVRSVHSARMRWVVKECDRIICVSRSTASDLHGLFPQTIKRTVVIPEALPARFLLKSKVINHKSYILAIGARSPRKNIPRLISAWKTYKSRYRLPEKLIIIGERPNRPEGTFGVEYTGYVSDQRLVDLMAGAVAFVYPSLYEGFGIPLLIAWQHQVPVACSDTSCFPEVAGKAAHFFDPTNPEAIASAISQAIKQRTRLITAGTSRLTHFSWTDTAAATIKVYQQVC